MSFIFMFLFLTKRLQFLEFIQIYSLTLDGDKPDEDSNGISAVFNLKAKLLLAIEKLREKKATRHLHNY